uniref:Uncharacterized protein n=1 Tax=Setaria viridis TaxID=4556 RepID=A0A4U6VTQ7_SETVI|nr:hypothetical protein SEVIR_2G148050v2 [Setaria viridis]
MLGILKLGCVEQSAIVTFTVFWSQNITCLSDIIPELIICYHMSFLHIFILDVYRTSE